MSTPAWQFYDVNEAYCELMTAQKHFTEWEDTRNGRARVFKTPVMVTHHAPWHRVLFDPKRDANPFFHYMEAIWMLAGAQNVDFPAKFASNIRQYSDDDVTLHGAYGYRWRGYFGIDQIQVVIGMLKDDPTTRRAVISMWAPNVDLGTSGLDLPCNTHIYFRVRDGRLCMTVCNRSNDLVWGMLGANIVHFSILQEYIAKATGLITGELVQFTNNLHIYEQHMKEGSFSFAPDRWYSSNTVKSISFGPETLYADEARRFVEGTQTRDFSSPILNRNAIPMLEAWEKYKEHDITGAIIQCECIHDSDWRHGCQKWLQRRQK